MYLRPPEEITRARNLLVSVMRGDIPKGLIPWNTQADEVTLRTAAEVLCWLCGDDDGDDFSILLELLERARIRSHAA